MAAMIDLLPVLMLNRKVELITLVKLQSEHVIIFVLTDENQVQLRGERVIPVDTDFTGLDDLLAELWASPNLFEIN